MEAATAFRPLRRLVVVLGDQLTLDSGAFDGFDPEHDLIWMAEVRSEAIHVWSHRARIALFLSAMRHFRDRLREAGWPVHYRQLGEHAAPSLESALAEDLRRLRPQTVRMSQAGEYRVQRSIEAAVAATTAAFESVEDRHFLMGTAAFARWVGGRRQVRTELLYRLLRNETGVLVTSTGPVGGNWNFDRLNRKHFGRSGPPLCPAPLGFGVDATTAAVIREVRAAFPGHPGSLEGFDWPVTAEQAAAALEDFVTQRLAGFGPYQDAMWTDQPYLFHSRLSAALNLKLLAPGRVVAAAEAAWREGRAPLASVEGFIRQILGWRELVRGVYWQRMPGYLEENVLGARLVLPGFYWTGDTDFACLRTVILQVLATGYAHHIQRLMVTGLFALLLGVNPQEVHRWYLAMYVDAVEWVELPNTLGMSQYADGGFLASKPYVASGRYIQRMSNYCQGCRYDPGSAVGPTACPFTTLYWDFLDRHRQRFAEHPRAALQWRSLARVDDGELRAIRRQADALRVRLG